MAQCKLMDKKELVRLNNGKRVRFEIQEHLGLRCRNGKTFFTLYYHVEGKKHKREMILGEFPVMSLSKANQLARKYNAMLKDGKDPLNVCRCTPVKETKQKVKESNAVQQSLFTLPLNMNGKLLTSKKKDYVVKFKSKAEYDHFCSLLLTAERAAEDLSSYITELRKMVKL